MLCGVCGWTSWCKREIVTRFCIDFFTRKNVQSVVVDYCWSSVETEIRLN